MNERQLECFLAIVRNGNFSSASRALYISQPAISHQIRTLEDELGVQLFERTTSQTLITPAGRELIYDAEHILASFQRIRSNMKSFSLLDKPLVLGCPIIMFESNQSTFFEITSRARLAHIPLDSRVALKPPHHITQLLSGEVDLTICDLGLPDAKRQDISSCLLFHSSIYIFMHQAHPLADKDTIRIEDIDGETVYWYANQTSFLDSIRSELQGISFHDENKESFAQTIPFLHPSAGVTFYSCPFPVNSSIVCRPFVLQNTIDIGLIWRKQHRSPYLKDLIEIIKSIPAASWSASGAN